MKINSLQKEPFGAKESQLAVCSSTVFYSTVMYEYVGKDEESMWMQHSNNYSFGTNLTLQLQKKRITKHPTFHKSYFTVTIILTHHFS
jgi:hypothetical protein